MALPTGADLERLRAGLRIIALRALGDSDAAEDAVQEALSRAVVALAEGRLSDASKLPAYVAGIARHVCQHVVRDRKDTVQLDGGERSPDAANHPQLLVDSNPLDALINAAESERLRRAFDALSAGDQQLLRLCYHEQLTPAEVAESLREPGDRVRKRKSRALERLRRAFLGEGHEESAGGTDKVAPLMPSTRGSGSDNG